MASPSSIGSIRRTPTDARKTKLTLAWRCSSRVARRPRASAPTTSRHSRLRPANSSHKSAKPTTRRRARRSTRSHAIHGDAAVCDRLGERYANLYASCKAGNANDCESLSLLVWPKKQTDVADNACKSGDTIACRVVSSSASAMKVPFLQGQAHRPGAGPESSRCRRPRTIAAAIRLARRRATRSALPPSVGGRTRRPTARLARRSRPPARRHS